MTSVKREKVKVRYIGLLLSVSEYEAFMQAFHDTTCRSKSEYSRKMLLGKPVTVYYRNRSLDDFIEIAVKIKRDLRSVLKTDIYIGSEKEEARMKITLLIDNLIQISQACWPK